MQYRIRTLGLKPEITNIASNIYGSLVPSVSYYGQFGEDHVRGKEPLLVYVVSRSKGISDLNFILEHSLPENSPQFCTWRENLISDTDPGSLYEGSLLSHGRAHRLSIDSFVKTFSKDITTTSGGSWLLYLDASTRSSNNRLTLYPPFLRHRWPFFTKARCEQYHGGPQR